MRQGSVIIIDADAGRAERLADAVARRGGDATRATSGAEAIRLMESAARQCMLVASLADGSARAFVAWARRNYPSLTLLAAADDGDQTSDLYAAGADHVMSSPTDADWLGAQLEATLRARGQLGLAA